MRLTYVFMNHVYKPYCDALRHGGDARGRMEAHGAERALPPPFEIRVIYGAFRARSSAKRKVRSNLSGFQK